jgi:hypothetical protein
MPTCSFYGYDCGPDFCGGSCGECTAPTVCDLLWQRCCTPVCDGTSCADGCGGECPGACGATEYCHEGRCVAYGRRFPGPCEIREEPGLQTTHYTYDSEGRMLEEIFDNGSDGSPDRTYSRRYDERGNLIREEWDDQYDGVIDDATEYQYDDQNRLTIEIEIWEDGYRKIHTLVYDGDRLVREDVDMAADGIVDEYYAFSHYPDGKISTIELIDSETGVCEISDQYWYTAAGDLEKESVSDCNGESAIIDTYEYDNERRLTKRSRYLDPGNGEIAIGSYEYDDFGFLSKDMAYRLAAGESFAHSKWYSAYFYRNDELGNVLDMKYYEAHKDHYDAVTLWSISDYTYNCFH